jgi:hypothetical protein
MVLRRCLSGSLRPETSLLAMIGPPNREKKISLYSGTICGRLYRRTLTVFFSN